MELECMFESLKTANKVVGLKQSKKTVAKGLAKKVFIAEDAQPWIIGELLELCEKNLIEIEKIPTMKELGKACSVEVPTACAVLLKD